MFRLEGIPSRFSRGWWSVHFLAGGMVFSFVIMVPFDNDERLSGKKIVRYLEIAGELGCGLKMESLRRVDSGSTPICSNEHTLLRRVT